MRRYTAYVKACGTRTIVGTPTRTATTGRKERVLCTTPHASTRKYPKILTRSANRRIIHVIYISALHALCRGQESEADFRERGSHVRTQRLHPRVHVRDPSDVPACLVARIPCHGGWPRYG